AGGPAEWLAAAATVAASLRFRSLPLALAVGLAVVWVLRRIT
ncbi:MAG TPA: AzlD domain-containing protein, partial [Desulfovibrio sp.]|nr:AzlD domain-containing protein [Desulfovibrio sp.]